MGKIKFTILTGGKDINGDIVKISGVKIQNPLYVMPGFSKIEFPIAKIDKIFIEEDAFEICPLKRTLKGFQGFRYCTKLF